MSDKFCDTYSWSDHPVAASRSLLWLAEARSHAPSLNVFCANGADFLALWLFTHFKAMRRPQYRAIREAFTGRKPANYAPTIETFELPDNKVFLERCPRQLSITPSEFGKHLAA